MSENWKDKVYRREANAEQRLARIERQVRELADALQSDAAMDYKAGAPHFATGKLLSAEKIRAILDAPEEET